MARSLTQWNRIESRPRTNDLGDPLRAEVRDALWMLARQWQWYPVLILKKGVEYRLHLSSLDIQHGFSLQPTNLNLQVLPGYDYVANITPTQSGEFSIICNEFCGIAHHIMVSKVIVTE